MWNGDFSSLLEAPFSFLAKRTEREELARGENIWKCDLQGGRPSSQPPEALREKGERALLSLIILQSYYSSKHAV